MSNEKRKPWKRVLYEKQDVPDNYVDESFLTSLRKDPICQQCSLAETIVASCRVAHEVSCVALFVVAYLYLQDDGGLPYNRNGVYIIGGVAVFLAFTALLFMGAVGPSISGLRDVSVFLLFGYGFAPLLKNLTETISTDTIYAMVSGMFVVHVLFQDYGASAAMVSGQLSLNAALSAAVCLASRLPSSQRAFLLLTLAADLFAAAPVYHRWALTCSSTFQILSTCLVCISAISAVASVSTTFAVLLFLSFLFVTGLCPYLFICWQREKENIHGPWDEAVPETTSEKLH